jgi:hypothetical protein
MTKSKSVGRFHPLDIFFLFGCACKVLVTKGPLRACPAYGNSVMKTKRVVTASALMACLLASCLLAQDADHEANSLVAGRLIRAKEKSL